MRLLLQRIAEKVRLVTENEFLRERVTTEEKTSMASSEFREYPGCPAHDFPLKDTRTPVLISGETHGKELAARAIHFRGPWQKRLS